MFRTVRLLTPAAALVALAACQDSPPTGPRAAAFDTDFAALTFGASASAMEGTLGLQGRRPFDGSTVARPLPDSLKLTPEQLRRITELRVAFVAENAAALAQLRAAFERARTATENGASREEVRAILEAARPTAEALRPKVGALHAAIQGVLTPAQRAWLDANKPQRPRGP